MDETTYGGQLRFGLARQLWLRLGYRFNDLEEKLEPSLKREEEQVSTHLEWSPIPTVDTVLSFSSRDETEDGELIRSTDTIRLRALTELLPDLRLTSELAYTATDDPFSGFEQTSWKWLESIDSRPTDRWTLGGSVSYTRFDSTGTVTLTQRTSVQLRTIWQVAPYLTLTGDWDYGDDDLQSTLSQRYGAVWSPGRRLNVTVSHQDTSSSGLRGTSASSARVNYRLNRWFTMWLNVSRSTLEQTGTGATEVRTFRLGLDIFF